MKITNGEIKLKELCYDDMTDNLLDYFNRYQEGSKVWRIENGKKIMKDCSFTEFWDNGKKKTIIDEFRVTLLDKGVFIGAFEEARLIGFATLSGERIGENNQYIQLLQLHVSFNHRGKGIGKMLFQQSVEKAKEFAVDKLYISSHSSIETINFYTRMGCKEATWLYEPQVKLEPYDCQLEYNLRGGIDSEQ